MVHPRFEKILEEMKELHYAKDHDYAGKEPLSNFRESSDIGVPPWKGVFIRLSDKYKRSKQLIGGTASVKSESLVDSLMDLANYAIICRILYEELHGKIDLLEREGIDIQ